ncbi:MAG: hypothetical protein VKL97_03965 [Cyanobacteriota bacterium]|nr:hypothetical protein [Cyanobacteriota bacterium]
MARSGDDRLEQRLDRWVEAGRQLVDGVSGARPGSRSGLRRGGSRLNPGELGRWVENKLEWLLDDDTADDWREPQPVTPRSARPRRPLEARSRRRAAPIASTPAVAAEDAQIQDWPSDELFSVPRWQRQPSAAAQQPAEEPPGPPPLRVARDQGRPLPRSSRRR